MFQSKFSIFVYVTIGLALIGFVSEVLTSPATLFKGILITIFTSLVVFAFIYFLFLRNRSNTSDMRKYKKAVKQSKLKYKGQETQPNKYRSKQHIHLRRKNRKASHLRVIDGNKSKRRNRATY